jgi:DNA polymerase-3 subunit gamma/tau
MLICLPALAVWARRRLQELLAKALNCEQIDRDDADPCGQCSTCLQIDSGRYVDYLELDAASHRGVEEMAQLLENAIYAPTLGRWKVYVIDEVHMLSNHAFNAMLKTLEEPPGHVVFVLATTDPQKVPVTVLSRCLQLALRNMTSHAIAAHLAMVLEHEQIAYEAEALNLIGKAAAGSMRDALSLLDQAISHGAGEVKNAAVLAMLGAVDQTSLPTSWMRYWMVIHANCACSLRRSAPWALMLAVSCRRLRI